MVNVRVGQQDKINISCFHGQLYIFVQVLALLHATVYQTADIADFDQCAAACDFMGSADKC